MSDAAYREDVEIALREYERAMEDIGGCGNHGCLIKAPTAWASNPGCQCWMDKMTWQRALVAARRLRTRLRELKPIAK